ncbi:MAG: CHASE2 domain-containing protein, partial [Candidatus Tectomicrobia bacterium]
MRIRLARLVPTSGTLVGLLLTALVWLLFVDDSAVLHRLELLASDLRFRIRGPKSPGPEVVIAAIDEKSIDQLGRWPWPFTIQARLIDRLTQYGAAAIGYDVVFSSSDTSAGLDNLRVIKQKLTSSAIRPGADVVGFVDQALAEA